MGASDALMCPLIHFATRQNALNGGPTLIVGAWPRWSSPDPMHNLPPGHRRLSPSSSLAPPAVLWIDPDGFTAIHHAEGIPVIRDWPRTRRKREDAWRASASPRGPGTGDNERPGADVVVDAARTMAEKITKGASTGRVRGSGTFELEPSADETDRGDRHPGPRRAGVPTGRGGSSPWRRHRSDRASDSVTSARA